MTNAKPASKPEFEVLSLSDDLGAVTETVAVVKRRAVRIDVKHFDPPVTIGKFGMPSRSFKLKNIAEYGCSFFTDGVDLSVAIGQDLLLQICIGKIVIPVRCRVLYLSRDLAGMEFIDPSESSKLALRTHFFFEFGIVGLGAAPKVEIQNLGKRRTISYGEVGDHGIEITLEDGLLKAFRVGLSHIGTEVRWEQSSAIRALVAMRDSVTDELIRNQLICFLRNVRGLNPFIRKSMEEVFVRSQIDFQYI